MIAFLRFITILFTINLLMAMLVEWRTPGFVSAEVPFAIIALLPVFCGCLLLAFDRPLKTKKKQV